MYKIAWSKYFVRVAFALIIELIELLNKKYSLLMGFLYIVTWRHHEMKKDDSPKTFDITWLRGIIYKRFSLKLISGGQKYFDGNLMARGTQMILGYAVFRQEI